MGMSISIKDTGTDPADTIGGMLDGIRNGERPAFSTYSPDLDAIEQAAASIGDPEHLVVIGNGGSVTTLKGLKGLVPDRECFLHIIDTIDPSYVMRVRKTVEGKAAHVIAVSKSGKNLNALENLTAFRGIPTTVVTARKRSPLGQIAKANGWGIVEVPDNISGRFSGRTASALLPAMVMGIDIAGFSAGIGDSYKMAVEGREAIDLSGAVYLKERVGLRTFYIPVYSRTFSGFNDLVTQLLHESLCKERKGLTVLCHEGPEVQHHTNQRIMDGPEDVMTLFVTTSGSEGPVVSWDGEEADVMIGDRALEEIGGYSLGKAFRSEYEGVMGHMRDVRMPFAHLSIEGEGAREMGQYVGLWHYLAYFFSLLRRVDPFDQPAVEKAKDLGMAIRLAR